MNEVERFSVLFKSAPSEARLTALAATGMFLDFVKRYSGQPFENSNEPQAARQVEHDVTRSSKETSRPSQPAVAAQAPAPTPSKKELEIKRPFPPERRAAVRLNLVRRIYEPDLSKELVDRLVALQEAGVPAYEISAAADRAKDDFEAGRVRAKWVSLSAWAKAKFEERDVEWTPCSKAYEPEPEPLKPVVYVDFFDKDGRQASFATQELTDEQATELSFELQRADTTYSATEVKARVQEYAARLAGNKI